ncbi:unnamed protein product [Boreogadus saida]
MCSIEASQVGVSICDVCWIDQSTSLPSGLKYNPPHRTDQTHLQPLSNHVDCYKAAGMKADMASGPDRRTEYNPPHRTDQTHLQPLSNHVDCYKAAGMKADVGQIGEPSGVAVGRDSELCGLFVVALLPQWRDSVVC